MPPGSTPETVDAMSLAQIAPRIDDLRQERYRWTPVRRTSVPTKERKTRRPWGRPSWSDTLLQDVLRALLEAYDEPQFSEHAHGFRPGRGCHTALNTVHETWTGTTWDIEGDSSQCVERIDPQVLRSILQPDP